MMGARMNAHPDELLDGAVTGSLRSDERARLGMHLAGCLDCTRYLDVADSLRETVDRQPQDDDLDRRAINRAIERSLTRKRRAPARVNQLFLRWAWLPAVGLLLMMTAVVSAKLWRARIWTARPAAGEAAGRLPGGGLRAMRPAEGASETEFPAPRQESLTAGRPRRTPPLPTAAQLFARAGELARRGQTDAAVAVHFRLQRLYPGTPEAGLASALAGGLLLRSGKPAAALAQFDRHLAGRGAADEEALAGRASALQQLGRRDAEVAAWRALLQGRPDSVYGDRARSRLRDLDAR